MISFFFYCLLRSASIQPRSGSQKFVAKKYMTTSPGRVRSSAPRTARASSGEEPPALALCAASSAASAIARAAAARPSGPMLGLTQLSIYLTLKGSFSAVSKPKFVSEYALESSRRDLQNALLCTVLESTIEN